MSLSTAVGTRLEAMREADFATVAALAATIWRAHYPAMVSMAQIDYMLAERYTPGNLRAYLNSGVRWFEMLWLDEKPAGYCSYALAPNPGEMKLEQLYILAEHRGMGWGGLMLRHVEAEAHRKNARWLVLQVNKRNHGALAMYRKAGFRVREAAVFDIGGGYCMDDYVMEKPLCL